VSLDLRRHVLLLLAAGALLTATAGCRHVRPYDRGKLAHPTMTGAGEPGPLAAHVYAVHEGAVGGSATPESGCGCN
jgi:hypothetical protein